MSLFRHHSRQSQDIAARSAFVLVGLIWSSALVGALSALTFRDQWQNLFGG
jgi:hypothetical protein